MVDQATGSMGGSASPSGADGGEDDPFLKLHKMSTTAGLGSGDYVAINGNAIAAILLGIASALMLMGSTLLLLIPVAGVICSVLGFRQIGASNGTQAGRGLAGLGLLLSLGFGGFYCAKEGYEAIRDGKDQKEVVELINLFGKEIAETKYTDAYSLCDQRFKDRVLVEQFAERWKLASGYLVSGPISGIEWNNLMKFDDDAVTGERVGSGMVRITYIKVKAMDHIGMVFRKINEKWYVDDIPEFFPPRQQNGGLGPTGMPVGPTGKSKAGPT